MPPGSERGDLLRHMLESPSKITVITLVKADEV
jgi:hypothetical protein